MQADEDINSSVQDKYVMSSYCVTQILTMVTANITTALYHDSVDSMIKHNTYKAI